MGSEGYLINQFLAPHTNHRTDRWGGSAENRMRFPVEIVRRIREALGEDFLVMYRMSLLDLVPDGQTWDETVTLAQQIEEAGASVINTGIGWHEARVPTIITQVPRAAWAATTARLRPELGIPVCASNRINSPEVAEEILASGGADLVSMARPFLADPDFVDKAAAGRADEINTCIGCNQACLDHTFANQRASCLVNPRACHETTLVLLAHPARRRVAVVGAGPAGLAAAVVRRRARPRRHAVRGLARARRPVPARDGDPGQGGVRLDAALLRPPARRARGRRPALDAASPGRPATPYDEVVVATGVTPRAATFEGADHPKVVSYAGRDHGRRSRSAAGSRSSGPAASASTSAICSPTPRRPSRSGRPHWGVGDPALHPGGLTEKKPRTPAREVYLLQRKTTPVGKGLAKTSGWAHRAVLQGLRRARCSRA